LKLNQKIAKLLVKSILNKLFFKSCKLQVARQNLKNATKREIELVFDVRRNHKIITPCCNKSNNDGKFVNYKNLNEEFGYCHSCGKATLPPSIYIDENENEYYWNDLEHRFEAISLTPINNLETEPKVKPTSKQIGQKYTDESIIWQYFRINPENNLLQYYEKSMGFKKTDDAKETYA